MRRISDVAAQESSPGDEGIVNWANVNWEPRESFESGQVLEMNVVMAEYRAVRGSQRDEKLALWRVLLQCVPGGMENGGWRIWMETVMENVDGSLYMQRMLQLSSSFHIVHSPHPRGLMNAKTRSESAGSWNERGCLLAERPLSPQSAIRKNMYELPCVSVRLTTNELFFSSRAGGV